MLLARALLAPHLPTLLVDEHRRHRTPMLEALRREGERFRAERPEVVVALSARWESAGPFHVDAGKFHRTLTDYPDFGVEARYDCLGHPPLARALVEAGMRAGVRVGPAERGVDSGVSVPLHFLLPARDVPVVPLSVARRPPAECLAWGEVIRAVLGTRRERIGFVVGGMLSHATHAWNFRREVPEAAALDRYVLEALGSGAWNELRSLGRRLMEKAQPEAELRHLEVLRGFLGADVPGEVHCYDAGPGMGAALVAFEIAGAGVVAPALARAAPVVGTGSRPPREPKPGVEPKTTRRSMRRRRAPGRALGARTGARGSRPARKRRG